MEEVEKMVVEFEGLVEGNSSILFIILLLLHMKKWLNRQKLVGFPN